MADESMENGELLSALAKLVNSDPLNMTGQSKADDLIQAHSKSKVKLMQSLKKIRTINYALQFCSLLIAAQELETGNVEKKRRLCNLCKDGSAYSKNIMSLQKIASREPFEIVKIICRALDAPKKKPCKKEQQLLKIVLKYTCEEEPSKYLDQLIGAVESLVESLASPALYEKTSNLQVKDSEKHIVSLKKCLIVYGTYKIEPVFHSLFCFTLKEFNLDSIEVKEIGNTMVETMPCMEILIVRYCFKSRLGVVRLKIRSALQSLRDLLAGHSAKNLYKKTWEELIYRLDKVITEVDSFSAWNLMNSLGDVFDADSEEYSEAFFNETVENFYEAGARFVPKEHIWWQIYKRFYI